MVRTRIGGRHVLWSLALAGGLLWPVLLAGYTTTLDWDRNDSSVGYAAGGFLLLGLAGWLLLWIPAVAVATWYARGPGRRGEALAAALLATLAPLPSALLGALIGS